MDGWRGRERGREAGKGAHFSQIKCQATPPPPTLSLPHILLPTPYPFLVNRYLFDLDKTTVRYALPM